MNLANWSDEELRKAFDSLIAAIHNRPTIESWSYFAALALSLIGLSVVILLLDRASWWEISCIVGGVVGVVWARRLDASAIARQKLLAEIKEEIDCRRAQIEAASKKFTEEDFLRMRATILDALDIENQNGPHTPQQE